MWGGSTGRRARVCVCERASGASPRGRAGEAGEVGAPEGLPVSAVIQDPGAAAAPSSQRPANEGHGRTRRRSPLQEAAVSAQDVRAWVLRQAKEPRARHNNPRVGVRDAERGSLHLGLGAVRARHAPASKTARRSHERSIAATGSGSSNAGFSTQVQAHSAVWFRWRARSQTAKQGLLAVPTRSTNCAAVRRASAGLEGASGRKGT